MDGITLPGMNRERGCGEERFDDRRDDQSSAAQNDDQRPKTKKRTKKIAPNTTPPLSLSLSCSGNGSPESSRLLSSLSLFTAPISNYPISSVYFFLLFSLFFDSSALQPHTFFCTITRILYQTSAIAEIKRTLPRRSRYLICILRVSM